MAREHANIRLDMWADDDWRSLSRDAQWLYELLLTHPKTNRAGVCEWHPGRLSRMAADTSPADIEDIAAELVQRRFIVVDESTQEVVIRSYIKHDGILKQPNMTTTMANDFAGLASPLIRGVIVFEIQKLRDRDPELGAWKNKRVQTILDAKGIDAKALPIGLAIALPIDEPLTEPIDLGSRTSTSTSTKKRGTANRGTRIDSSFQITAEMRAWAQENTPNVDPDKRLPEFIDYWAGVAGQKGVKLDWLGTWRNDMRRKQEFAARDSGAPAKPKKRFVAYAD